MNVLAQNVTTTINTDCKDMSTNIIIILLCLSNIKQYFFHLSYTTITGIIMMRIFLCQPNDKQDTDPNGRLFYFRPPFKRYEEFDDIVPSILSFSRTEFVQNCDRYAIFIVCGLLTFNFNESIRKRHFVYIKFTFDDTNRFHWYYPVLFGHFTEKYYPKLTIIR